MESQHRTEVGSPQSRHSGGVRRPATQCSSMMNHEPNPWRAIAPCALLIAMAACSSGDANGTNALGTSGGIAPEAPAGSPECATAANGSSYLETSNAEGGARIDDIEANLLGGQFLKRGDIVVYADTRRIQTGN